MLLENRYYRITGRKTEGQDTVFRIVLLSDCEVYQGHFPGNPVWIYKAVPSDGGCFARHLSVGKHTDELFSGGRRICRYGEDIGR